ncbi:hypothetical protein AgCh_001890 [Apium graveolens]
MGTWVGDVGTMVVTGESPRLATLWWSYGQGGVGGYGPSGDCMNFNTKEIFWQYQVDKYGGLTDLKDDHLSFGLRLGMRYIPKIADIFVAHGFKENKTYNCLRFVEMMEKDLEFTPEVIFKKLKKSKQLLYLDSLGVFVNRKDLKPMSYLIDRFFLANHWFRLESLATRLGCTPSDKKAKLDLEFN